MNQKFDELFKQIATLQAIRDRAVRRTKKTVYPTDPLVVRRQLIEMARLCLEVEGYLPRRIQEVK